MNLTTDELVPILFRTTALLALAVLVVRALLARRRPASPARLARRLRPVASSRCALRAALRARALGRQNDGGYLVLHESRTPGDRTRTPPHTLTGTSAE